MDWLTFPHYGQINLENLNDSDSNLPHDHPEKEITEALCFSKRLQEVDPTIRLKGHTTSYTFAAASPSPSHDSGYSTPNEDFYVPEKPASRKRPPSSIKEMCSVGQGLTVKNSSLPYYGVGNGVYADQPFEKGEFITWYDGEIKHFSKERDRTKHLNDQGASSHTKSINRDIVIIGIKNPKLAAVVDTDTGKSMGAGSFINDPIDPKLVNVEFHNRDDPARPYIYIKAKRKIKAGEELLISYGNNYWVHRGGKPRIKEYSFTLHEGLKGKLKCIDREQEHPKTL